MKLLFIALLTLFHILQGEERTLSLANTNGDFSGIVDGHVSVITGDYLESRCDFAVIGPEPILHERFYASSNYTVGSLYEGWRHNFFSTANLNTYVWKPLFNKESYEYTVSFVDNSGTTLKLLLKTYDKKKELRIPFSGTNGFTNTSQGNLSGRTNLKNLSLYYDSGKGNLKSIDGRGTVKEYKSLYQYKGEYTSDRGYFIKKESRPSGNVLLYDHDNKERVTEVKSQNSSGATTFGWVRFHYPSDAVFNKTPFVDISTSDDRSLRYELTLIDPPESAKVKGAERRFRIHAVQRKDAPLERFEYKTMGKIEHDRLTKRLLPEGRYLSIQYEDSLFRVKHLLAPVGHDATPIVTRSFVYGDHLTEVYDAYNHKVLYRYSASHRLTAIQKYTGTSSHKFYSIERFVWGKKGTPDEGNLLARVSPQGARTFVYDAKGNVLVEKFYGNLTGQNETPIVMNAQFLPIENGCDCYEKHFTYSNDKFNLLLSETESNGKHTVYSYKPGTDLMVSKLIYEGNALRQSQFLTYDANGVLIETTTDDKTIRFTPKATAPCLGLPEIEEGFAKGKLLYRKVNSYLPTGKLLRQERYDSNSTFCYALEWDYDAHGNCTLEKDALGQVMTRNYDANDNLIFEQGPRTDFHKEYTYDFSNRLIRDDEVYADGKRLTKRYEYDFLSNRISETDIYGNTTRFEYDEFGRVIRKTSPLGSIETYAYDVCGNVTAKTDARGNTTHTRYNVRNKQTLITHPDGTEERFVYNLSGTLKDHTDRNGMTTRYTYDFLDRVVKKEGLTTTSATYDAFRLLSETDEMGVVTNYNYNDAGKLISVSKAGALTLYAYDPLGRKAVTKEFFNETEYKETRIEYDLLDHIVSEKVPGLYQIDYAYDEMGNCTETRSLGVTKKLYNAKNQVIRYTDEEGNTTYVNYYYDEARKEKIDPLGNITITLYDNDLRPSTILRKNSIGKLLQKQEFLYDLNGNKTSITVDGITTLLAYDSENRCISCTEANQKITRTTYTSAGQKATVTKPDGVLLNYVYDMSGRNTRLTSSDGTIDYAYTYDPCGRPIHVEDLKNHTITKRSFDPLGHPTAETLANGLTLQYTHDRLGRLTQIKLPDDSGIAYAYNAYYLKEVTRLDANATPLYTHTYTSHDLSGNPLTEELIGNAGTLTNQYDLCGRPRSIQTTSWTEDDIQYDAAGNLTAYTLHDSAGTTPHTFSYDDLYQLKTEPGHTYQFDSLYNRTHKDTATYTLNDLNQLTQETSFHYTYDKNGNLLSRTSDSDTTTYTYDALDQIITHTHNSDTTTYTYDPFHRRLTKNDTRFLYHDDAEIGSLTADTITELRLLTRTSEVGDAIAIELNNQPYAPLHDHNGNLTCLLSITTGLPAATYRYTAFGEESLSSSLSPWRFSSKRHDPESSHLYSGRRYYSPSLGRWLTPDPLGFADGPNLYAYVHNNPLIYIDPDGLQGIMNNNYTFGAGCHSRECERDWIRTTNDWGRNHYGTSSCYQIRVSDNKDLGFGFINGISTNYERSWNVALHLTDGRMNFYGVHSDTKGIRRDALDYSLGLICPKYKTDGVRGLHQIWDAFFNQASSNGQFLQIAHSRGALDVRNALLTYDPERCQRIHVLPIAPAAYIDSKTCGSVVHYRASRSRDLIPYIDGAGAKRANSTIVTLKSHPHASFFDHDCLSPTYAKAVSQGVDQFVEKFRYKR